MTKHNEGTGLIKPNAARNSSRAKRISKTTRPSNSHLILSYMMVEIDINVISTAAFRKMNGILMLLDSATHREAASRIIVDRIT